MERNLVKEELERIRIKSGGVLNPVDVVKAARSPRSPLHSQFEWDDSVASEKYRLIQAGRLIRVHVDIIDASVPPVRAYVSLQEDRHSAGGYRPMVDVMNDAERREALVSQALAELNRWRQRYEAIHELAAIHAAIRKVTNQRSRRKSVPVAVAAGD